MRHSASVSSKWYNIHLPQPQQRCRQEEEPTSLERSTQFFSHKHQPTFNTPFMKKRLANLLLTATHSFKSSPSGSITAIRRLPLPSVASACFSSSYWWDPSGIFFFGLKVLEERLPLWKGEEIFRELVESDGKKKGADKSCISTGLTNTFPTPIFSCRKSVFNKNWDTEVTGALTCLNN